MIPQVGQIWKRYNTHDKKDTYVMLIRYKENTPSHGDCWDAHLLGYGNYLEIGISFGNKFSKQEWDLVSG
jgi:hypothetical protein